MGGVGRAGGSDLELPYTWLVHHDITVRGQWMYPREAPTQMVKMIRGVLIDPSAYEVSEFDLDEVNEAITHAAANAGPTGMTVLRPDRPRPTTS